MAVCLLWRLDRLLLDFLSPVAAGRVLTTTNTK